MRTLFLEINAQAKTALCDGKGGNALNPFPAFLTGLKRKLDTGMNTQVEPIQVLKTVSRQIPR